MVSIVAYVVGLLFYAFHFPECKWPGKFDIWGSSHQVRYSIYSKMKLVIADFNQTYFFQTVYLVLPFFDIDNGVPHPYQIHYTTSLPALLYSLLNKQIQLWHLGIVVAIVLHYRAIFVAHGVKHEYSCAAPGQEISVAMVLERMIGWR